MKIIFIISIFLLFFVNFSKNTVVFAQNLTIFENSNTLFSLLISKNINESDSILKEIQSKNAGDIKSKKDGLKDTSRLSITEFMNANSPRYTITGSLPFKRTQISPTEFGIVGGTLGLIFVGQHIYQANTIWKDKAPQFKIEEDWKYSMAMDKATHFFGTYFPCYVMRESLLMTGFDDDDSYLWGTVLGFMYNTYVEIEDGFGLQWGFSPTDWYADIAGASFFYLQHQIPFLQNFTPKFHYYPSNWHGELPRIPHDIFIDDYSSQTVYMSVNVHNLLPEKIKDYWPKWLNISCGVAVRNLFAPGNLTGLDSVTVQKYYNKTDVHTEAAWGSPRYIIALDYDMVKLLPDGGAFWNWFKQTLNYWKFPAPAIEFSEKGTRFYLMYPFAQVK